MRAEYRVFVMRQEIEALRDQIAERPREEHYLRADVERIALAAPSMNDLEAAA